MARTKAKLDAFMKQAREHFKTYQEASAKQRQRELDDIKFYNGDQWPAKIKAARAGTSGGGNDGLPPAPARPCLTIDQTRGTVNVFINQIRNSDIGIELIPADDFGISHPISDQEISLREGLVRRIQREPETEDASLWGASRGIIAGLGYWLVMTRFVPGKTWDQEIYVDRIYNQASVTLGPHDQPDGSDAEEGFIGTDISIDQYRSEYSKIAGKLNRLAGELSAEEFRGLGDECPGWFTTDEKSGRRSIRIVDYYYMERESRELALLPDGSATWDDEVPTGVTPIDTRTVVTKKIKWCKLDGIQILDETDWLGKYLPIVKYVANELHDDGDAERKAEGAIRSMRDPAMGLNYMVSKQVESVALAPIPPWVVVEGTVTEDYRKWWENANTRTLPYLPYKQTDLEGRPAPPPTRTQISSGIGDIANSVVLFKEAISDTSGVHDPSVGRIDPALRSGKAISLSLDQDKHSTGQYVDNYAKSKRHEGRIINDLLYPIYGTRPGRIARIVNGEGEATSVHIASPAASGLGQLPTAMMPGMPAPPQPLDQQWVLTPDADFNIVVKLTKSFETRRQEESAVIGQLLQVEPQLISWFGDLFFKNQDGPGHEEMAERAKVMLAQPIQQAMAQKANNTQPIPPMVQQHIQQLTQELQKAQEAAKGMSQALQTDQIKHEAQIKIEDMKLKAQASLQIELKKMDIAAKIESARITASKQAADLNAEAREEAIALQMSQEHDTNQAALDRAHEIGMAGLDHAQTQQQGAQDVAGQAALSTQDHQQVLEQGAQQAALQPEPQPVDSSANSGA